MRGAWLRSKEMEVDHYETEYEGKEISLRLRLSQPSQHSDKAEMADQEDIDMIEDTKVWLQSPERKAPKKERDYAVARLDGVVRRIRKAMQSTLEKMKAVLLHADKKKSITEEIKKQTKPSIVEALRRGMEEQRKKDSEKQAQEKQKKQNMEL